jgi:hypothetical protein
MFDCQLYKYLAELKLRSYDFTLNLDQVELDPNKIPFVTASSSNHFTLFKGLVRDFRKNHPTNQLVFYDLGLNETEVTIFTFFKTSDNMRFLARRSPKTM